jgi:hypothetical protein
VYTQRAGEAGWRELNELIDVLPYPVANPLGKFLGSTAEHERLDRFSGAFESLLHVSLSLAYQSYIASKGPKQTSLFKNWQKASAGPLWGMLRQLLELKPRNAALVTPLQRLLEPESKEWIDKAIASINDHKHHRAAVPLDHYRILGLLGNALNSALSGWRFGFFEEVRKKGFSGNRGGLLRVAHGKHAPFVEMFSYEGKDDFSDLEAVVANVNSGEILRLSPFIYWTPRDTRGEKSVAMLDMFDGAIASYRSVEGGQQFDITSSSELRELQERCASISQFDPADSTVLCQSLGLSRMNSRAGRSLE